MDLKSLRAFKKVCETGSISKAADALYITQPGLSKSMARLEAECGHQLFERTSKGVMLTPYGRALYARIDQLVAIMDEIESETLSLQRSRKLKVASTIGVLLYTGMAFTDDFEAAFSPNRAVRGGGERSAGRGVAILRCRGDRVSGRAR